MKKIWELIFLSGLLLVSQTLVQCSQTEVVETDIPETSSLSETDDIKTITATSQDLADRYLSKSPADAIDPNFTMEQAQQIQAKFVQILANNLGNNLGSPVGYKAGLTSTPAQENFGVSQPVLGVLFEQMLRPSGAVLPANFGVRPMTEGDLMVRVGSDKINHATTLAEALANLDAVIPFIEVPDLVYGSDVKMDGRAIAAINVGARYGIVGEPIPLNAETDNDWQTRLASIRLEIFDAEGNLLATGNSNGLLGHPLNVVLWIKDALKAEGKELKQGDLLSLGTITPLMPVTPNTTIRAKYMGLDPNGDIEIFVKFE